MNGGEKRAETCKSCKRERERDGLTSSNQTRKDLAIGTNDMPRKNAKIAWRNRRFEDFI